MDEYTNSTTPQREPEPKFDGEFVETETGSDALLATTAGNQGGSGNAKKTKRSGKQKASMDDLKEMKTMTVSLPLELVQALDITVTLKGLRTPGKLIAQILSESKVMKQGLTIVRTAYAEEHGLDLEE